MSRFVSRPDDIFVATYPRSGTSLLQMLLLQLSTQSDAPFRHIEEVIPFLDHALKHGESLEQFPSPRILKTHLGCRIVTRWSGKFVYVVRDGEDVLVSYFYFCQKYVNPALTFDQFFGDFMRGKVQYGSWFRHVSEWLAFPDTARLLVIRYEDMVQNLDATIDRLAFFLKWSVSAERRLLARERCQFSYMRTLESKFEPVSTATLTAGEAGAFFRQGRPGAWRATLTPAQSEVFREAWRMHGAAEVLDFHV
jgi:hypothetical protein